MGKARHAVWLVLGAILAGCSRPGAARREPREGGLSALAVLQAGARDQGFARALDVRRLRFPRAAGPHPAYQHEWWYWTGHLTAQDGEPFGFELTFFRVALRAPDAGGGPAAAAKRRSRWRASQIYIAHFAVTDIARQRFDFAVRYARAALGLAGAQASPFKVWLDGWSVRARAPAHGWVLRAADAHYGLTLDLRPLSPPVLNGDHGLSVKSSVPGSASYYYSIPRFAVRGHLRRGQRVLTVKGTAWLDREWGSGGLGPREVGWDWFALQFANGSDLMFYALRDRDGARDPHSAGTWVTVDGRSRALSNHEVHIRVLGHWRSPGGTVYPSRWRLRVPALGLDVRVVPVLADQELKTRPVYWEGDVRISGTQSGRAVHGRGYVELVGYARPR